MPLKVYHAKIPELTPAFRTNGTITPALQAQLPTRSSADTWQNGRSPIARACLSGRDQGPRPTARAAIGSDGHRSRRSANCSTRSLERRRCRSSRSRSLTRGRDGGARDLGITREKFEHQWRRLRVGIDRRDGPANRGRCFNALEAQNLNRGVAALCIGGGEADRR